MSEPAALPPALILAAGKGTRLGELGRRTVKALLPVSGRPLLDWHLDHLARQGVTRAVVNAHHNAEQLVEHVRRYPGPVEVAVLVEPRLLGTAGAAVNALDALQSSTFFVVYGDVLLFESLPSLLATHRRAGAVATLSVYRHGDTGQKGVVEVDDEDRITGFFEKDPARVGPGLVNAGLYAVEATLLAGHAAGTFLDFGHDVFPAAMRAGDHLQAHRLPQPVLDIGTPEALARAGQLSPAGWGPGR